MTTSSSHLDLNTVCDRLEDIRVNDLDLNLREFWLRLGKEKAKGRSVTWVGEDERTEQVSYSSIKNYHFDRTPPLSYLLRVCEVFNVKLDWLAKGTGPRYESEEHIAAELAAVEREGELEARQQRASSKKRELDALELDDAEREADHLRRSHQDEGLGRFVEEQLVRGDGVVDHPMLASPAVRAVFGLAWDRLAHTCDDDPSPEQLNSIGRDLLKLLEHPLREWGFEHEPRARSRRFEDYAIAMCHALMLGMAEPGRGDPSADLGSPRT